MHQRHALLHDWPALFDELRAYRAACGPVAPSTGLYLTGVRY